MCTVLLPPGVNPIAVNKYIIKVGFILSLHPLWKGENLTLDRRYCYEVATFTVLYEINEFYPRELLRIIAAACTVLTVGLVYVCNWLYRCALISADSVSAVSVIRGLPRPEKYINKRFISSKTRVKREQAVTLWNLAAKTRPVLDSSFFAPVLTLPRRTCLHSASSVHAVRISWVIAMFVFRKSLFIN
jgi:hypothetical protein